MNVNEAIRELIQPYQLCALATIAEDKRPWVRYVMMAGSDDLTIYVTTFFRSRKVAQIRDNPEVHLTCGVSSLEHAKAYLQIEAQAEISTDPELKRAQWRDLHAQYFSGPDDENFCVLVIKPTRIEYYEMGAAEPTVFA